MTKRTARAPRTQAQNAAGLAPGHLVEPMLAGMTTTRQHLLAWVHAHGLAALDALFREEAVALAGPKGRHQAQRTHHHWGTAATELTFGGRRVQVRRPRVRPTSGGEATLPSGGGVSRPGPADRADDAAVAGRGVDARLRRQSGGPAERAGHPGQ